MKALKRYLLVLSRFSPRARTAMIIALDLALCIFASLLAYSLRTGEWQLFNGAVLSLVALTCAMWLLIGLLVGVYRSILRFSGGQSVKDLARSCAILALVLTVPLILVQVHERIPRTLAVLVPLILFVMLATSRLVLSSLLRDTLYSRGRSGRREVLIYGAGVAGRELAFSIEEDPEFQVIGFVDDMVALRGRRLEGYSIWHSSELGTVLGTRAIDEILLAMPTASRARRRQIVEEIRDLAPGVGVRSLPNLAEIAAGRVSVSDLRVIQIEELLGRDEVIPDPWLMSASIRGQSVMVTGAGGSIGSELCRQILLQSPSRIMLAERSELALYLIDGEIRELRDRHKLDVEIDCRLTDVADAGDMERVYRECRPDTVFHAAAYKHVPLVEADPIAGIRNNVVGTHVCAVLGEQFGVRNFTLVSTDKAVRPSSVMGASKRVCEMIVQARATAQTGTRYSAVRFGNVLGSSGSVVPLFRRQIAAGGPVTITHRDATRYFMTVSEAAQLVVQAGAMAEGGEIFLLEMGEPVRIYDLAAMMIQLSGLAVVDGDGGDGDIQIIEIGLRPGEKLHEELLIGSPGVATSHPRIVKALETAVPCSIFNPQLEQLLSCLERRDCNAAMTLMEELLASDRSTGTATSQDVAEPLPPLPGRREIASSRRIRRESPVLSGKRAFES